MTQGTHDGQTTTIDGNTYRCLMLDPLVATDMVADLGYLFGPSLGALGGALMGDTGEGIKKLLSEGGEAFAAAFEKAAIEFFGRFDKAKQREFISLLSDVTYVRSGETEVKLSSVLTVHFRGRVSSLYKWLGWALKVQFGDFFSPLKTAISHAVRTAQEQ